MICSALRLKALGDEFTNDIRTLSSTPELASLITSATWLFG
jgi:hypothetical protein